MQVRLDKLYDEIEEIETFIEASSSVFLYFSMNRNYMNLIGTMKVPLNLCSL